MTPDQLRALADALDDSYPPYYESSLSINRPLSNCIDRAAAYLRACADARPVAYRLWNSDQGYWYYGDPSCAEKDDELLYTRPAPAAPQPLSDERIDAALQTDPVLITRLMTGSMTVGEFRAALRRLARIVEHAHKIGGSDE